jgi:hypothetical protein
MRGTRTRTSRRPLWTGARRVLAPLAALGIIGLLTVSVPAVAVAAPVDTLAARAESGPVRTAVTDSQTIVVNVGGVRTSGSVSGLAGVRVSLYTSSASTPDAPGTAVGQPWSTCTSNASGVCTFVVPNAGTGPSNTKGENNGKRFWVVQTAAPADYYLNPTLITGNNTNSGSDRFTQTPYVYRTPALTGSGTITLPSLTGMPDQSTTGAPLSSTTTSTGNRWATGGLLPVSQANNRVQATCQAGLTVGILFDLSSSMSTNNNEGLNGAKAAGKALVDALADTGSQVALYTFGTNAPKSTGADGKNYPTLTTVTSANAGTLKGYIDGYTASGSSINYTNWDRGLWQVAESSNDFDIVVVLTDGNPTVYGPNATAPSSGNAWTTNRHVEEAIFSANALKNKDTQVLTFGVGDGISLVTGDNLRSISGPLEWTGTGSIANYDYAKTNDWTLVASQLKALAAGLTCKVPITVTKYEELLGGTTQLGQGWTFGATKSGQGTLTGNASQTTGANGKATWSLDLSDAAQTGSVTITETIKNSGWQLKQVVCTNNGEEFYSGTSLSFTLPDLGLGDNIACTVTNQQVQASVVVNKTWVVNGTSYANGSQVPSALQAALTLGGTSQPFGTARGNLTIGSTTTITETVSGVPALCTVVSQRLTGPGATNVDMSAGATFTTPTLAAGLATYELTNTVTCTSQLELIKDVVNDNGGTATPADWTLYYGATGVPSGTTVTVTPGTPYVLTESTKDGYAPRATNPLVCSAGLSGTTVTVPIATKVTCTFTNDDIAPTLSLTKIVSGADAVAPTNWTLTASAGATAVLSGAGGVAATAVTANTPYTLAETSNGFAGAADFTASRWSCQTNGTGPWTELGAGGVLPGIAPGDAVECRITNTPKSVSPTITKTVDSLVSNADGTWTVTYTVTVANPNKYQGLVYDLTDTLRFGAGIAATATASGPSPQAGAWNGVGSTVLADDVALAASSSHEYVVTAIATVPTGATAAVTDCPTTAATGGFLNTAVLTVAGTDYPAEACAEPVTPTLVKSAGTATANADGTWSLTYTVAATNDSDIPLVYDLVDDPQATLPTGVTLVSGSVSPAGSWNGTSVTTLADDATLAPHSTTTYTVTIVVSVAPSVKADALDCTVTDGGLVNAATLTSGNQTIVDDACLSVTPPTIVHDKTVTSTAQNADGTWTIVYDVTVTNTGSVAGLYDLSDELLVDVPGTLAVVSASADGVPAWNGTTEQTLATARLIAPGADNAQHYTITVVAAVAEGAIGSEPARCDADGGTNGFLNSATITVAGVDTVDTACSTPTRPTLIKSFVEAVPAGGNDWTVTYLITVDNSAAGAQDAYYTLTDAPGFPAELAIVDHEVVETSADPDVTLAWNGGALVPTPRVIAGGAVDTFRVSLTATVPAGIDPDVLECGASDEPGLGFQNAASITVGADVLTDADCGDVTESAVPTIAKTVVDGWPKQNADGSWEIAYDITVTSDSTLDSVYSLTDSLGYGTGITVTAASVTSADVTVDSAWNGDDHTTIVSDVILAGGDTHTYRVTVTASVAASAWSSGATACDVDESADGGFLNTATLTSGQADPRTAADCASPAQPTITKVVDPANPPAAQANGSWLVTYLVTVDNPSALTLAYDLDDTLGMPSGVTVSDPTATGPQGEVTGWDGVVDTSLATGASLAPNATDVYTITVVVTPTSSFDIDDAVCTGNPGSGLFNAAVLASGGIEQDADACADLPLARVTLIKEVDNSAFDGLDLGDATLGAPEDWVLGATGPTEFSGTTGTDAVTGVLVTAGSYELGESIDLESDNPLLPGYVAGDWTCTSDGLDGAILELAIGDDVTCTIVNTGGPVDLAIVKTDGGEADGLPLVPTTEGGSYEYTFVVTNQGDTDATNVVVTDVIPATLAVDVAGIVLADGWTATLDGEDPSGFGGTLTLRYLGSFASGAVAEFTIPVDVAATLPRVDGNATGTIADIVNTAVVDSDGIEETPQDNTSTETTPVRSLAVSMQPVCTLYAPYASWSITPSHTDAIAGSPVVLIWWTADAYAARDRSIPASDVDAILADGAAKVDVVPTPAGGWVSGVTVSGTQLWPGATVDPVTLEGTGWPGWLIDGDGDWALDPSAPFYALHESAVLEVRMNPSTAATMAYPQTGCLPTDTPTLPLPPDPPTPLPPMLAFTGLNLLGGVAVGVALLGFGIAGRFRRRGRHA